MSYKQCACLHRYSRRVTHVIQNKKINGIDRMLIIKNEISRDLDKSNLINLFKRRHNLKYNASNRGQSLRCRKVRLFQRQRRSLVRDINQRCSRPVFFRSVHIYLFFVFIFDFLFSVRHDPFWASRKLCPAAVKGRDSYASIFL